ncbi:ret finger protein-like 4A [Onychomys torridus]|uniref:ret finger protein-like 4A n=1 Tax=Onychomys torridus TaxID=38674 RepID=UPI00167FA39B|nr:ret finger protein-like 4A [Onychomys torridus]
MDTAKHLSPNSASPGGVLEGEIDEHHHVSTGLSINRLSWVGSRAREGAAEPSKHARVAMAARPQDWGAIKIKGLEPQPNILKMNPGMKIFQVNMTFDVDTAHDKLIISDDLRSVYFGSKKQDKKECAERFQISTCVLGSSRFTSGRHYWEVVVGTGKEWDIGVCKDSVNPQDPVDLSDEHGFWTVGVREGDVYAASTEPLTVLTVNPRLHRVHRVGVFLDLQKKSISFWDLSDGSHIFSFFEISESDAYCPLFIPANSYPDDQEEILTICPVMNPRILGPPVNP